MAHSFDFLVLGGGVAGLSFALEASEFGTVAVLTKRARGECNTAYAQGGIASVLAADDSFDAHIEDTLTAGAGLCRREAVEITVREGPERIKKLVELGAEFDRKVDGGYDLTREGGHSKRRIVHAGDITGRELERSLLAACDDSKNITFFPDSAGVDFIRDRRSPNAPGRVLGAYVLRGTGVIETFLGKVTVLATGGAGKVYLYTSNPDVATGDGVAMAYRAGAKVANMEFFQFHPTCLFHPEAKSFLISEALRGEGGMLRLKSGERFMDRYHSLAELAPRDVVARAIDAELKRTGDESVFLDMTSKGRAFLMDRFPNIYATCKEFGIDMGVQPIPVVPAAHFMCGGVVTDAHGRTTLEGLYAIGETACTGLHGANRLASNSLLEGLVFGHRAVRAAAEDVRKFTGLRDEPTPWDAGSAIDSDENVVVTHNWDEVRRLMWNYVGIVRTDKRLMRARRRLELLREEIRDYYWRHKVTRDMIELRNISDVAWLIVECAARRIIAPTTLSFVAFDIEGPLGVILLGVTLVLVALFVLYALALRTNMLMESRRHNQELQAQRKLAESAETSRINELRTQIEQEFAQLRGVILAVDTRMDTVAQSTKQSIDEATNSLAALVGEMDDKIDRALARGGS